MNLIEIVDMKWYVNYRVVVRLIYNIQIILSEKNFNLKNFLKAIIFRKG